MRRSGSMFDNDYTFLATPNLLAMILREARDGGTDRAECQARLGELLARTEGAPDAGSAAVTERLDRHLRWLEVAGLIEGEGRLTLTGRGEEVLARHPRGVDLGDLKKFPEFAAYLAETAPHSAGMDPRLGSYDAGYAAGRAGEPFVANPHGEGTADHISWENGWMQALDENDR